MSMEFLETVGQVTLYVLIAVMAAGVAVAMGMLLGLLAAIIHNKFEKDDTKMPKGKDGKPVLKSLEAVRKRVVEHGGAVTNKDKADI